MNFNGFSDLITLPNNHFIIATDKAIYAGTATLKPGTMTISALGSVNYLESVWKDIKLTALGVSTFVLSYDTGFISVDESNTFGAVVGSVIWDMANKVPNVTFATAVTTWKGGFPVHGLFALSDTTFVVAYASNVNNASAQLACNFVRYANGKLTLGPQAIYAEATPEYYISAVGLDGSSGVIVFVDRTKDFALRAVVVHRSSFQIDGVHFGDSMTIEDGVADSFYTSQFEEGSVPFIDSAKVSANKVVVAWADYSNSGKLTTAILTVDQAVNLHSSPLYVIGQALATDQLANYTVSVAGLSIDAYGQVGAVVIDRKPATDAANSGNVALVEVAPKAFGVAVQNAFAGQSTKIVVNGLADLPRSFPTDLQPGHLYYGLTDGSIEAGPLAGTVDKSAPYVTLSDGTIVTVDSAVGVAVSKRQLYVLPSFN
jgi:predicted RecA/RadA family phage recombinase